MALITVLGLLAITLATGQQPTRGAGLKFITIWDTTATSEGSSEKDTIKLPLTPEGVYDFEIDWGDGTTEHITKPEQGTHKYTKPGTYTVTTTGTVKGWRFADQGDKLKIVGVSQWAGLNPGNGGQHFKGCTNLLSIASDSPDLTGVESLEQTFYNAEKLSGGLAGWDVSTVTNFHEMFAGAKVFNQNIGSWQTTSATDMSGMFTNAAAFNQPIGGWNTASVTSMESMFYGASSFNQPIGNWDVGNVESFAMMFNEAAKFNQPIGDWDVGKASSLRGTFGQAKHFNQNLENWDTRNVKDLSYAFYNAKRFNQNLEKWNTRNVTNMRGVFTGAANFNADIQRWKLNSAKTMESILDGVPLSTERYNALLESWSGQKNLQRNVKLGVSDGTYSNVRARNTLIQAYNWDIKDKGQVPDPVKNLQSTYKKGQVHISWEKNTAAEKYVLEVTATSKKYETVEVSAETTKPSAEIDVNLLVGSTYVACVAAVNHTGLSERNCQPHSSAPEIEEVEYSTTYPTAPTPAGTVGGAFIDGTKPTSWSGRGQYDILQLYIKNKDSGLGHTIYNGCLWYAQEAAGYTHAGDDPMSLWPALPADKKHADRNPPPGAVLLYSNDRVGHAVVYLGGGQILGTDMDEQGNFAAGKWSIGPAAAMESSWNLTYLGWYEP